jgi:hypothetical protein
LYRRYKHIYTVFLNYEADTHAYNFFVFFCPRWFSHVSKLLQEECLPSDLNASWAAYHANLHPELAATKFISAIMPLFYEVAKTVAMIQHSMYVIRNATMHLNPGQTPVIAMDQPLFALAKKIQWDKPHMYGEHKFIIMFGGLHIEMAAMKTLGDWLSGSGWTDALSQSKVASPGTANSFLKASPLTRTRQAHQITFVALHLLLEQSYNDYKTSVPEGQEAELLDCWCEKRCNESPQFHYWYITLHFQLLLLIFI